MNPSEEAVVEIDDPELWLGPVRAWAEARADKLRGSTLTATELRVSTDAKDEFWRLLAGRFVRAYHATRLLDHEVEMIRQDGLRPLSAELLKDRIEAARAHNCITAEECKQRHGAHVFATGEANGRAGQVYLVIARRLLQEIYGRLDIPLTTWGGEGIHMSSGHRQYQEELRQLGKPTMVVAQLDVRTNRPDRASCPQLPKIFAGRLIGSEEVLASVHQQAGIPPDRIEDCWQPGDPGYDRMENLPRE